MATSLTGGHDPHDSFISTSSTFSRQKTLPAQPVYHPGIEVVPEHLPEASPRQFPEIVSTSVPRKPVQSGLEASPVALGATNMNHNGYAHAHLRGGAASEDNDMNGGFYAPAWGAAGLKPEGRKNHYSAISTDPGWNGKEAEERNKKKERWYIAAIALLLLALIAVAAVLGWKYGTTVKELDRVRFNAGLASSNREADAEKNREGFGAGATNTNDGKNKDKNKDLTSDSESTTTRPKGLKKGSSLAATGVFFSPGEDAAESGRHYEAMLFFQDEEDFVVSSVLDSRTNSWSSKPKRVFKGKENSPLAACAFKRSDLFSSKPEGYQYELFHNLGPDGSEALKEWSFSAVGNANGSLSRLNGFGATFPTGIATYWPSGVWYEGGDGRLSHVWYTGSGWRSWGEDAEMRRGTRVVALPVKVGGKEDASIFFQGRSGNVEELRWKKGGQNGHGENTLRGTFIPLDLKSDSAEKTSLAGLAMYGESDSENLEHYILYLLPGETNIKVVHRGEGGKWSEAESPDALKGADKGSDITCISRYTVERGVGEGLNRCFFFVEAQLREVGMESGSWRVLGRIPV